MGRQLITMALDSGSGVGTGDGSKSWGITGGFYVSPPPALGMRPEPHLQGNRPPVSNRHCNQSSGAAGHWRGERFENRKEWGWRYNLSTPDNHAMPTISRPHRGPSPYTRMVQRCKGILLAGCANKPTQQPILGGL